MGQKSQKGLQRANSSVLTVRIKNEISNKINSMANCKNVKPCEIIRKILTDFFKNYPPDSPPKSEGPNFSE